MKGTHIRINLPSVLPSWSVVLLLLCPNKTCMLRKLTPCTYNFDSKEKVMSIVKPKIIYTILIQHSTLILPFSKTWHFN